MQYFGGHLHWRGGSRYWFVVHLFPASYWYAESDCIPPRRRSGFDYLFRHTTVSDPYGATNGSHWAQAWGSLWYEQKQNKAKQARCERASIIHTLLQCCCWRSKLKKLNIKQAKQRRRRSIGPWLRSASLRLSFMMEVGRWELGIVVTLSFSHVCIVVADVRMIPPEIKPTPVMQQMEVSRNRVDEQKQIKVKRALSV